jgi:hypothetical protein
MSSGFFIPKNKMSSGFFIPKNKTSVNSAAFIAKQIYRIDGRSIQLWNNQTCKARLNKQNETYRQGRLRQMNDGKSKDKPISAE